MHVPWVSPRGRDVTTKGSRVPGPGAAAWQDPHRSTRGGPAWTG
ncbi:Hypothetical protein CAP_8856 [Chondromyces apiculatus DSM 436]|uniref:Uncharacterized protein n=1 Tax=Chondromyces apiculatus DSM 436 TaxID=1192034 RepID=A0A017SVH9_9BACT|nr:Hypothetical protein CAP_8856 [Chondromyces apiculatus DSM 436]